MPFSIWVDADSCPVLVRDLVVRFSLRLKLFTFFVANRVIPLPPHALKSNYIKMIVTDTIEGAADDYIADNANSCDMVITRDIPLAARLLEKNITVINDRGSKFTSDTINEQLSVRNFHFDLAQIGIQPTKSSNYSKKELNNFANCFDRELQNKLK